MVPLSKYLETSLLTCDKCLRVPGYQGLLTHIIHYTPALLCRPLSRLPNRVDSTRNQLRFNKGQANYRLRFQTLLSGFQVKGNTTNQVRLNLAPGPSLSLHIAQGNGRLRIREPAWTDRIARLAGLRGVCRVNGYVKTLCQPRGSAELFDIKRKIYKAKLFRCLQGSQKTLTQRRHNLK